MAQSMSLVGLDVHASQTHAAVLDMATGELRGVKLRMPPGQVVEFLARLPGPLRTVDEAGPTGFGLARIATDRGIDVRVVAAGKVRRVGRCGRQASGATGVRPALIGSSNRPIDEL